MPRPWSCIFLGRSGYFGGAETKKRRKECRAGNIEALLKKKKKKEKEMKGFRACLVSLGWLSTNTRVSLCISVQAMRLAAR